MSGFLLSKALKSGSLTTISYFHMILFLDYYISSKAKSIRTFNTESLKKIAKCPKQRM